MSRQYHGDIYQDYRFNGSSIDFCQAVLEFWKTLTHKEASLFSFWTSSDHNLRPHSYVHITDDDFFNLYVRTTDLPTGTVLVITGEHMSNDDALMTVLNKFLTYLRDQELIQEDSPIRYL